MPLSQMAPLCSECTPVVCPKLCFSNHAAMPVHLWSNVSSGLPWFCMGHSQRPDGDKRKAWGLEWGEQQSWFWPRPWISEKNRTFLFVSYTWLRTQGIRPRGQRFLAHMVKNKQVALGIFFPAGLPLTIGQEWAFIKVTQPLINSY